MRRREFISLVGGAAAIPFVAHAQQSERMRTIGVLFPAAPDDPVFQARLAAFHQELALLGWIIGRNVRIDTRWATTNPAEIRRNARLCCASARAAARAPRAASQLPRHRAGDQAECLSDCRPAARGWRRDQA